ncbi:MAG: hypothetical protein AABZ15_01575 [Nitrospirota bacterium]
MKRPWMIITLLLILPLFGCGDSSTAPPPAAGSAPSNPILVSGASYSGSVGTGMQYIKLTGLLANNMHSVTLAGLTDNANIYVYSDAAFTSELCRSEQPGTTAETCSPATTNASGELYIKVDGSLTTSGTSFSLAAIT